MSERQFLVTYRGEFAQGVYAEDEESAITKAQQRTEGWELIGELHQDFFEVEEQEGGEIARWRVDVVVKEWSIVRADSEEHAKEEALENLYTTTGPEIDADDLVVTKIEEPRSKE